MNERKGDGKNKAEKKIEDFRRKFYSFQIFTKKKFKIKSR